MSGEAYIKSFIDRFGGGASSGGEGPISIWREANLASSTVLPGPFVDPIVNRCVQQVEFPVKRD